MVKRSARGIRFNGASSAHVMVDVARTPAARSRGLCYGCRNTRHRPRVMLIKPAMGPVGVAMNVPMGIHHGRGRGRGMVHALRMAVHHEVVLLLLLVTPVMGAGLLLLRVVIVVRGRGLPMIEIWHRQGGRHVRLFAADDVVVVVMGVNLVIHGIVLGSHGLVVEEEPCVHIFGFADESVSSFIGIKIL